MQDYLTCSTIQITCKRSFNRIYVKCESFPRIWKMLSAEVTSIFLENLRGSVVLSPGRSESILNVYSMTSELTVGAR